MSIPKQHTKKPLKIVLIVSLAAISIVLITYSTIIESDEGNAHNYSDTSPLLIGTCVWPGYEPLYLARDLGYYGDMSVRLVEYTSATQVLRAFRNGTVQVAALTLDEVLLLREQGHQAQVILVLDISVGADAVLGRSGINDIADLKGKRVGVENTAVGGYVLTRALQSAGLSPSDVTIVPLENNEHEREFKQGEIDAVVTYEPVRSRILNSGAKSLFDSSQIPNEIFDVLVVYPEVIKHRHDQLLRILQIWFQSLDYLQEHPIDAAQQMSVRMNLTPDELLASFDDLELPTLKQNIDLMVGDPSSLHRSGNMLATIMVETGLLEKQIYLDNCFQPVFLNELNMPVSP